MRLDRFLSEMGVGTRSEIKGMVKKGRVRVCGQTALRPDVKIDPVLDPVELDGRPVAYAAYEYFMLYKPAGCVCATRDSRERTVMELITDHLRDDLFPVGRLDKDTEGLLLVTNDGPLSHQLLSPGKHVDKVYYARVRGCVTAEEVRRFREGLSIGDETCTLPAKLDILEAGPVSRVEITIREGRYHQIKRMFQALGMEVLFLKRLSMGPLTLDPALAPGQFRRLTDAEIARLKGTGL